MTERFTFFWNGPFSQWHPSPFTIDGIRYETAEHYMMWYKAMVFGDKVMAERVLSADSPKEAKRLGRSVKNFNKEIWDAVAKIGVFRGNMAKFTSTPFLRDTILATAGTTLVEASPVDDIWGMGLAADNPLALNRATWKGLNWLGEVLTDVRDYIPA